MTLGGTVKRLLSGPLFELLSGAANRPLASDVCVPLSKRLAGQSLLVVLAARERVALVHAHFDETGRPEVKGGRQCSFGQSGELTSSLKKEARLCGAAHVLLLLSLGWQAHLGRRAARDPGGLDRYERHRVMQEDPGLVFPEAEPGCVYAAVDHPIVDRSLVFGFRRKDLEPLLQEIEAAGLALVGVRLSVASQLELWLESAEAPVADDILVSDGMSVLLLNNSSGDFGQSPPRQASNRPSEAAQDALRFVRDNDGRPLVVLGPPEYSESALGAGGAQELRPRPGDPRVHDAVQASLASEVMHDFNPRLRRERAPLSPLWSHAARSGVLLSLFLVIGSGLSLWSAYEASNGAKLALAEAATIQTRAKEYAADEKACSVEGEKAGELREWLVAGYHAQAFALTLLSSIPEGISIEQLSARLDESSPQLSLDFSLRGPVEARDQTLRSMERSVLSMGFRIGERRAGGAGQGPAQGHRWRLILPALREDSAR